MLRAHACSWTLILLASGLAAADKPAGKAAEPTAAEIAKQVAAAAAGKPDWWEATALNYPQTLDLTCQQNKGGGWKPNLVPGQWMWDVVNPNPARWKDGTKFWHFVLSNAKKNKLPEAEKAATTTLGHCYGELLQDWPRAIYWYQQADLLGAGNDERTIALANAYWRLGSRTLAVQTLKPLRQDGTRHGSLIKQWADMGDYPTAYRLAQARVGSTEDIGWFMSGYVAQVEGSWAKALDCFKKAAAAEEKKSGRDWKQTKVRATSAMEAITLFEGLDLKRVADGTYRDTSVGYVGPVGVEVKVAGQRITSIRVTDHHEKQYYAALEEMPAKIIAKQHVKGIDATLGATITAEAIVFASAKALHQGQR